jgi:hypothetical protein
MSDMTHHILKRFSENALQIRHLILKNSSFRAICEDYGKCAEAIQYWDQSKKPSAMAKVEEYRCLCKELEKEVWQALKNSQDSYDKPRKP